MLRRFLDVVHRGRAFRKGASSQRRDPFVTKSDTPPRPRPRPQPKSKPHSAKPAPRSSRSDGRGALTTDRGRGAPGERPGARTTSSDRRQRRALSHVGGRITFSGDAAFEQACRQALTQRADEDEVRAHVHGFHPYPARLHPKTARALIQAHSQPGETVLDPFCGSGTVLVEALAAGRTAWGTDLNPLATALTKTKCRGATPAERKDLLETAEQLREFADERRQEKAGPTRKYSLEERAQFDIHVLLELDSLRAGIEKLPPGARKQTLQLVLSSLLVKLSRKASDTVEQEAPRRYAAGYPAKLFFRRTEEWVRQLSHFDEIAPSSARTYNTWTCDARSLQPIADSTVDLIVTSPPYPGVYDYYAHHSMRLSWLELAAGDFRTKELGAKRMLSKAADPAAAWRRDLTDVLRELGRVMRPGALACIIMADSAIEGTLLRADHETRLATAPGQLDIVAHAKQARPLFHRASERAYQSQPRFEHLLLLRRR